jgi:hypothetical protein
METLQLPVRLRLPAHIMGLPPLIGANVVELGTFVSPHWAAHVDYVYSGGLVRRFAPLGLRARCRTLM